MSKTLLQAIKQAEPKAKILRVGKWDWVYFESKPSAEIRAEMKQAGGHFNGRRICWQFSNGYHTKPSKESTPTLLSKYGAEELEKL